MTLQEGVTTENIGPDFHLTGEPLGNKIQLPKFLTVAIPSKLILPSNITLVNQGAKCSSFGVSISILSLNRYHQLRRIE